MAELQRLGGRVSALAGGLSVRRLLPAVGKRSVGPFVFFDHFGPVRLKPETDSDVGPHPHIGLATVSYLFEGSLLHQDSLGTVQTIRPGAINWMTAGRGIVHSERRIEAEHGQPRELHGLQLWLALPAALQDCEPAFQHVPAADLPKLAPAAGVQLSLLVGAAFGAASPVQTASPTLYLDIQLAPDTTWALPALAAEMALYSPQDSFELDGQQLAEQEMAVLPQGAGGVLRTGPQGARLMLIGGAPLDQPVRMWWNFVATDRQRLGAAAKLWEAGGFEPIPGDPERVDGPKWLG
jgi:redox-sensitive bicupin YhaK (pirin superfamily)